MKAPRWTRAVPVSGEEYSNSVLRAPGAGKGFMGVLPRGVEPRDIGTVMRAKGYSDHPEAYEAFGYTSCMLDLCQIDDSLQDTDPGELLQDLARITTKVFFEELLFCILANQHGLMCFYILTIAQGALLAHYLASKGNPMNEVDELKKKLEESEAAHIAQNKKYMSLREDHEKLLTASANFKSQQDTKIARLEAALKEANDTITTNVRLWKLPLLI